MTTGKTIQIFMPLGDQDGVRKASFPRESKVELYQVPRPKLKEAFARDALRKPGLYFLVAPDEFRGGQAYIGESDNCAERISYHHTDKKTNWDWHYALVCVSPEFNKAHVRWLEWHFLNEAKKAKRYQLLNPNSPRQPNIDEAMLSDLMHDVEAIRTLCDILGFPFISIPRSAESSEKYWCKGKQAEGVGGPTANGFMVYKGSLAMAQLVKSTDATVVRRHAELVRNKVLVPTDDGTLRFVQDYEFTSPSTAAAVVLGRSANGWPEWKDKAGRTLDEVKRKAAV
jgi:Domain of unknown function (DUF4357)